MAKENTELTIDHIKKILESGDFNGFRDKIEGDFFEAKKQKPYVIDSADGDKRFSARIELAGDIAAMANAKGGYIVCGLPTIPDKNLQTDLVKDIKLFKKDSFYKQEDIQEVLIAHIWPRFQITVTWHPSTLDHNLGIGSIYIPPQIESKKHFIVTAVEINGMSQKHFIAIPIRQGSEPIWMSAKQIYRIAASKKPNELKQVYDSLSGQIAELREVVITDKSVPTPADDIQRKIKEVLDVH